MNTLITCTKNVYNIGHDDTTDLVLIVRLNGELSIINVSGCEYSFEVIDIKA